jgi:uncharacterized membrane protein YdfJ with MMPL/SSD domain
LFIARTVSAYQQQQQQKASKGGVAVVVIERDEKAIDQASEGTNRVMD